MSEEEDAIKELMSMSQDELDLVPYDTVKLICQAKGCKRHTKVRDYGLPSVYYVKGFNKNDRWHNVIKSYFLCAKHWKLVQRLISQFDAWRVENKILDFEKQTIEKL